jgi:NAD(P)-dependent dehydrogenase (short-subunit alcohol dehydrogenase family)
MQDLAGLIGVLTGGGEGMGRAMALHLARAGMSVAVLDVDEVAARATVAECGKLGAKAIALKCDVTLPAELEAAALRVKAELGPVNLLWAHAGVGLGSEEGFLQARRESIRWMYAVNVEGVIDTVRTFAPAMLKHSGWRHVAITGSMAGLVQCVAGRPVTYAASKYATIGVAEALRAELEPAGIGVTLFCPGTTNTRMWDSTRNRPARFGGPEHLPEEAGERLRSTGMDPDEVAAFAVAAVRSGRFYAVMPDDAARAKRIVERNRAIEEAIHLPVRATQSGG